MNETPIYTEHHPRWYRKRVSTYWWLRDWRYLKFILRELSCLGVAYFVVIMLMMLNAMHEGAYSYHEFQTWMRSPLMIVFSVIAFLLVLYHTITWFNLAPSAMVVRLGGKRIPDWMIALPNYIGWIVVSAAIDWVILFWWKK